MPRQYMRWRRHSRKHGSSARAVMLLQGSSVTPAWCSREICLRRCEALIATATSSSRMRSNGVPLRSWWNCLRRRRCRRFRCRGAAPHRPGCRGHDGHPSSHLGAIGITGTDGKTTTSYLVDHILRSAGAQNWHDRHGCDSHWRSAKSSIHPDKRRLESCDIQRYLRQMVYTSTTWALLEATSHGLAMHRLDHVRFDIGAITNITREHLDFHGSVDNYRRAKAMLLERVAANSGVAVVNADDAGSRAVEHFAAGATIIRYSATGADADLRALDVRATEVGSAFVLDAGPRGRAACTLPPSASSTSRMRSARPGSRLGQASNWMPLPTHWRRRRQFQEEWPGRHRTTIQCRRGLRPYARGDGKNLDAPPGSPPVRASHSGVWQCR